MLVQTDPPERPSTIMDSPILARVERVILRHEEEHSRGGNCYRRAAYTQSLLSSNFGKESAPAIKRGLLWQQRDKLFSRWKERYFILTRDYLHCFRRASGADRISEMGQFLFKVKLVDVDRVEWENKKTYSTVALLLGRDGKIFLRAPEGLEDWFELIEACMFTSKERRKALRHSHDGKNKDNNNVTASLGEWLTHHKLQMRQAPSDSVSTRQGDTVKRREREWTPSERDWEHPTLDNRLSRKGKGKIYALKRWRHQPFSFRKRSRMLTDIDINSYDDSTLGAPSITSYRLNQDVLCIQPPSLRAMGSFRSTKETASPTKKNVANNVQDVQFIKFRERSYSDIPREDRRFWKGASGDHRRFH